MMASRFARWALRSPHMSTLTTPQNASVLSTPLRHCSGITYLEDVDGVPPPGAFSRATVHGGRVFVSGIGGAGNDTATGTVEMLTVRQETSNALHNVATVLRAAGSSPDRIISATMLLTDKADYAECNAAYVDFFAAHGGHSLPSRSTALWGVPTIARVAFSVIAASV